MANRLFGVLAAAAIVAAAAAPGQAQQMFSDGFTFLKAVKDRDGNKAIGLISEPGSVVINAKERDSGNGALHIVTRERDLSWLSFLLAKGAKPDLQNGEGNTPLAVAAQIGWIEGAKQLLSSRAVVDFPNNRGETPLILAVHNRDIGMVELLLGRGANPKRADNVAGYSAIDYAKQDRRSAAILKLLEEKVVKRKVVGPSL